MPEPIEHIDFSGGTADQLEAVTGVHLMAGIGHKPALGFWSEAWNDIVRRPGAIMGLWWIAVVAFFACFAPLVASGHPLIFHELDASGKITETSFPLLANLTTMDWLLIIGGVIGPIFLLGPWKIARSQRIMIMIAIGVQAGLIAVLKLWIVSKVSDRDAADWLRNWEQQDWFIPVSIGVVAALASFIFLAINPIKKFPNRLFVVVLVGLAAGLLTAMTWITPISTYEYREQVAKGEARAVYTIIPHSPGQGSTALDIKRPGATLYESVLYETLRSVARTQGVASFTDDPRWEVYTKGASHKLTDITLDTDMVDNAAGQFELARALIPENPEVAAQQLRDAYESGNITTAADLIDYLENLKSPSFIIGTDSLGQDVLSQMIHACRLSISIGLVSTSLAVVIGVTVGAIMGYFGGWVDMFLYRFVEIFMAIPVLFLLIVAAAVLPRNTYVMMTIIGCFSWMGAARFIRAEFYKLRGQDFVQAARAVGLPLHSVLFRHMLPNGVTPVLVDASFIIAAAILVEAVLSFLGLGPANQASWGRLLSDATNQVGDFVWWLAIFPGGAIFLTVLAYNLIGEALRDAIDPKLKKARV